MHSLDAEEHMKLLDEVRDHVQYLDKGRRALVVSDPAVRAWLQRLVAPVFPDLKVMSNAEIQEESGAFA
jgi:flagellar biosynthesis component FlhA